MTHTVVIEALSLNYGKAFGFQEYLLNILKYFKKERQQIAAERVVIVCKKSDEQVFMAFKPELEVVSIDCKSTLHRYWVLNTLGRRLHLNKDDIILYTNNYSALTRQCRHILVIHDLLYLRKAYMPSRAFRIQRSLFVPRSVKIADKVIAISKWVKSDIEESFHVKDKSKVVAIYNYFDFDKFCRGQVTEKIKSVCKAGNYFLIVCSQAYHKNTITTLKAYNSYAAQGGTKRLIALGSVGCELQTYVNSLSEQVRNNIICLKGISNTDLAYLYQHASAYISSTLFEGLGMPIVEAMYFGLPCIVSDIPVVREVTQGKAEYFPAMDADALCRLMSEYKQAHSEIRTQAMQEMYDVKNTVHRYVEEINALARANRGG